MKVVDTVEEELEETTLEKEEEKLGDRWDYTSDETKEVEEVVKKNTLLKEERGAKMDDLKETLEVDRWESRKSTKETDREPCETK